MKIAKVSRYVAGAFVADVVAGALLGVLARKVAAVSKPLVGSMLAGAWLMITISASCVVLKVVADLLNAKGLLPEMAQGIGYHIGDTLSDVGSREEQERRFILCGCQTAISSLIAWKIMAVVSPRLGIPTLSLLHPHISPMLFQIRAVAQLTTLGIAGACFVSCVLRQFLVSEEP